MRPGPARRSRQLVEEGLTAAQHQRLDEQAIFVNQVRRGKRTGKAGSAPHDDVGTGFAGPWRGTVATP